MLPIPAKTSYRPLVRISEGNLRAPQQTEQFQIGRNEHTAVPTVIADGGTEQMAIQSTKRVSAPHHSRMNDRIVVRVVSHYTRSWSWEDNLRHFLCPEIAQVFGYFFVCEFRYEPNAFIGEYARSNS